MTARTAREVAAVPRGATGEDRVTARGLLNNSLANAIRVGSTSLVSLVLPITLAALLTPTDYSHWALVFGLAAITQYFDFGIPTAVQALVARAVGGRDQSLVRHVLRSGIAWSSALCGVLLLASFVAALLLPEIFPSTTGGLPTEAALVLLVVGNCASLVGNTGAAFFLGLHQAVRAAAYLVPARMVALVLPVLAVFAHQQIAVIAACFSAPLVIATILVNSSGLREAASRAGGAAAGRVLDPAILRFTGSLVVWSACMVLLGGVGVVTVGHFDFRGVPLFTIAAALATAIAGVQSALIAPVLSELGRSFSRGDTRGSAHLVDLATRFNAAVLSVTLLGVLFAFPLLREALLRHQALGLAQEALVVLAGVCGATSLRLTMTPMTYGFIASNTHRRILAQPLIEAVATVVLVVVLGATAGVAGAAAGLLIGAVIGVALALGWSRRASGAIGLPVQRLIYGGLLRPIIVISPGILGVAIRDLQPTSSGGWLVSSVGLAVSLTLIALFVVPKTVWRRFVGAVRAKTA